MRGFCWRSCQQKTPRNVRRRRYTTQPRVIKIRGSESRATLGHDRKDNIVRGKRYPLVRHVTEDEIHPRPISVSVRCRPTGTRLARPTILSTRNPGWRGNRGALAADPGLSCATPSAYVLPVEQYSEYKVNLIRPCLLRHLDRGKKTTCLKRPCLCAITALTAKKVQPEGE